MPANAQTHYIITTIAGTGISRYSGDGGAGNAAGLQSDFAFIGGGYVNQVNVAIAPVNTALYGTVVNGRANFSNGDFSFIGNGGDLTVVGAPFPNNVASGNYSFIGNGQYNISQGRYSFIGNGGGVGTVSGYYGNQATGNFSFIGNGAENMATGLYSFIGNGCHNFSTGPATFIGGGQYNTNAGVYSSIVGGRNNTIDSCAYYNFIGGGRRHFIDNHAAANIIGSGDKNLIGTQSGFNIIGSGYYNGISSFACFNAISGGYNNVISQNACFNTVSGGCGNMIGPDLLMVGPYKHALYNFIGAGRCNCIDATNTAAASYGVIGGGQNNKICAGYNHSFIGSGYGNCVMGNCSSILGGQGNVVTHNWASASGYNVASNQDCAFHANILVSTNMPPYTGVPSGTLQYFVAPAMLGLPVGACLVVTK